jgi:hypothetical protein
MNQAASQPIEFPDQDGIELSAAGVSQQRIEGRPSFSGTTHSVITVFRHDLETAVFCQLAEVAELHIDGLAAGGADASIDGDASAHG